MNVSSKVLCLAVASCFSVGAFATKCPPIKTPPPTPPVIDPTPVQINPVSTSGALAGALAGSTANSNANSSSTVGNTTAAQGQQQGQQSTNTLSGSQTLQGGNQSLTGGDQNSSLDASSGSDVDVGGDSYNEKTIFIPAIIPPTPPSVVAVGNIVQSTLACGPLQRVVKTEVEGTFFGLTHRVHVKQGFTYDLAPVIENGQRVSYRKELVDGDVHLFGSQPVIFTTVVGISGARNLALGGGSSSGSWAQGGGGTSSSMNQMVTNIQIHDCDLGLIRGYAARRFIRLQTKHNHE